MNLNPWPFFCKAHFRQSPHSRSARGLALTKKVIPVLVVELKGFEPLASSMPWKRSSQLSYSPEMFKYLLPYFHRLTQTDALQRILYISRRRSN